MNKYTINKVVQWLLAIASILLLLSGFGITKNPEVSAMTFGLLSKANSFKLHSYATYPFIVLLIAHIGLSIRKK